MALGPLTNLAMAIRLDPEFPKKLKDLYIMGGNMEGESQFEKGTSELSGEWTLKLLNAI